MPLWVTIQPWLFIITCWSRQYGFNLNRHPPLTKNTIYKSALARIRTQDLLLYSQSFWCSRPLCYLSRNMQQRFTLDAIFLLGWYACAVLLCRCMQLWALITAVNAECHYPTLTTTPILRFGNTVQNTAPNFGEKLLVVLKLGVGGRKKNVVSSFMKSTPGFKWQAFML